MADSDDGKNRCELCGASNADKVVINIPGTRQTTRRWVCQDHSEHPDWSAESGERKTQKPPEMDHQLSVGELIEELEDYPDEMGVYLNIDGEKSYLIGVEEFSRGVELWR